MSGMLLRNWYNAVAQGFIWKNTRNTPFSFGDGSLSIKRIDGTVYSVEMGDNSSYTFYGMLSVGYLSNAARWDSVTSNYPCIVFGLGDTPVTYDDYTLESPISTGITSTLVTSSDPTYDSENHCWVFSRKMTVSNSSASTMVIKEWGIRGGFNRGYTSSGTQQNSISCLFYREVLDTPFELLAGDTVNFTLTCRLYMPVL